MRLFCDVYVSSYYVRLAFSFIIGHFKLNYKLFNPEAILEQFAMKFMV